MFNYLQFSDSAKFADVARNIFLGRGFGSYFTFFGINNLHTSLFSALGILPVTPYSVVFFFKILGINDLAVIATSLFYFALTLIFVFLLARKIFKSKLVAFLSLFAVGSNYDLIHYAISGSSESPFIFEIVAGIYFLSIKSKWATMLGFVFLFLLYFTRPQAFIYIAGLIIFYLFRKFSAKAAVIYFLIISLAALLIDRFIVGKANGEFFLYSVFYRGVGTLTQNLNSSTSSQPLRGAVLMAPSFASVVKNLFYNLYNFYKLMPQIMNPYLFALFVIGLFKWVKGKAHNSLKGATIFMFMVTFLVTAASIPFFRYLHPVIPLIYIFAVETLVWFVGRIFKNTRIVILISTLLVLFLAIGQTLGIFLLDSRFEANTHNVGKPPVYVKLSQILKENTNQNQLVVTNLDTWGTWYGERKTVWFPLEPNQLIDPATGKIPFDAIYLTSYLIDDPNYYMGTDWRMIFNNPTDTKKWTCDGCSEIVKEFKLKERFEVSGSEDYDRQGASAILLIKK